MASNNTTLWQTIVFLFLSKFVKQADQPFAQKQLVNAKNIELASRFAGMVGDKTDDGKRKLTLLKALKKLEKEGFIQRLDEKTLQLSEEGFTRMQSEVQTAMTKIAQSFPDSAAKADKPAPQL